VGSVGAAVAVGKLFNLTTERMQHAISIASVQVTGMHESFGTDTKPFHVGRAAQNGLIAAILAQQGYGGSLEGLEAPRGWAHVVSTRENLTAEVDTLGQRWEISLNTFKPYPCDRIIHAAIDGWIELRRQTLEQGLSIADIVNVTARTAPRVLFLTDNKTPTTGLEGKFSVYHAAAVALLFGSATPTQFTDEAVLNQTAIALREKVAVTSDEAVEEHEAFVAVEFKDGKKLEFHVQHSKGSYENPLNSTFLETKFVDQVGRRIGQNRAKKAFAAYSGIANATDIRNVIQNY
jgi:aconitate decarboxylase